MVGGHWVAFYLPLPESRRCLLILVLSLDGILALELFFVCDWELINRQRHPALMACFCIPVSTYRGKLPCRTQSGCDDRG